MNDFRAVVDSVRDRIDLATLVGRDIDLRDGAWRTAMGTPRGACATMPRREGYAFVRALLGRPLPKATP